MGRFFDASDDLKTVKNHIGGKHTPHSVSEEAKQEYKERRKAEGASDSQIKHEIWELESY